MFNKPAGCITARRDAKHATVMDYFKELHNENLSPVGRLDLETEGLLFITDDGMWNQKLTHPNYKKEKCYEFWVTGEITEEAKQQLEQGLWIEGFTEITAPAKVVLTDRSVLKEVLPDLPAVLQKKYSERQPNYPVVKGNITITEGKNRQVRRMFEAIGRNVQLLRRVSIGQLKLTGLDRGEVRSLTEQEIFYLQTL